jgi:hypothetical protein
MEGSLGAMDDDMMGAYKVSNEAFMRYVVARAIDYVTPTPKSKSTLCLLLSSSFFD